MPQRFRPSSSSNPNLLPVSPKRGLTGSSAGDHNRISVPSSPPKRSTRPAKPATFSSVPDAAAIREKRQWTVARTLGTSEDGRTVTVRWKDTVVPARCIKFDAADRGYVFADGMRHYIAEKSRARCDEQGQWSWRCRWEPSEISKETMEDHLEESSEDSSESDSDTSSSDGSGSETSSSEDSISESSSESSGSGSSESGSSESDGSEDETPATTPLSYAPIQPSSPPQPASAASSPTTPRESIESEGDQPQQDRGSPDSELTFSDLPQAEITSLLFPVHSDLADYGPAVRAQVAAGIGDKLRTSTNGRPGVVLRRMGQPSVRPLQFRSWTVDRRNHRINLQDTQNAEAVMVHMQGVDVLVPCERCRQGQGVMQGCVVQEGFGLGECTNCHYGGPATRCTFRRDTTSQAGYRPARAIKHRSPKALSSAKTTTGAPLKKPANEAVAVERAAAGGALPSLAGTATAPPKRIEKASTKQPGSRELETPVHMTVPGERDFVFSPTGGRSRSAGTASSDRFVMSGGLGEMTASPTSRPKRPSPHTRSSSFADSSDDDVPLSKRPKRPKFEVIDLTSSPETAKVPAVKPAKSSSSPAAKRSNRREKSKSENENRKHKRRRFFEEEPSIFTPPSSPPPAPPPVSKKVPAQADALKGRVDREQTVPSHQSKSAVVSPEIPTSGPTAESTTARLLHRKEKAQSKASQTPSSSALGSKASAASVSAKRSHDAQPATREKAKALGGGAAEANTGAPQVKAGKSATTISSVSSGIARPQTFTRTPAAVAQQPARPRVGFPSRKTHSATSRPSAQVAASSSSTSATNTGYAGSKIPAVALPDISRQTTVWADQHFDRGQLTARQFSFIFHRADAESRDRMRRLLGWAWAEGRVPRSTTMAEFFAGSDEERRWLEEVVVARFCPVRPRGRREESGEEGMEGIEGAEDDESDLASEVVYVWERAASEWVPRRGDGESDGSSSGDGDGSSSEQTSSSSKESEGSGDSDG